MRWTWLGMAVVAAVGCENAPKVAPPAPAHASQPASDTPLAGKLLERIDAGQYSYLRLATSAGEAWAAVLATPVEVGAEVTVVRPMAMNHFESPSLHRTFDTIYFGTLSGAPVPAPAAVLPVNHPVVEASAPAAVHVEKAPGSEGKTIAEVWAGKDKLKDATVAVRGQVVKMNAGILGFNWVHLHDGTGSKADGTDDLTVTTVAAAVPPAVGDVVLVKGTVHLARDFGAGYAYPVIVENATITK
jgi:hypothetical protein